MYALRLPDQRVKQDFGQTHALIRDKTKLKIAKENLY